jgi:SAM-dependent methyltransferase
MKTSFKQKIVYFLRLFYLLQLADFTRYVCDVKRNWRSNKQFVKENPDIRLPPLSLAYDAYGHTNWHAYWSSGKEHARYFSSIIKEHTGNEPLSVCEWGCGSARVLRHLPQSFIESHHRFYGADYSPRTVNWCRRNIENIKFDLNTLSPPLPYESNAFDCLYSISVFTHLSSEMHFSWIREISRVVKSGGLIIFTTHGDACIQGLIGDEITNYKKGKLVVRGKIKEGKRCFVAYHPIDFVEHELLKGLEVISHFTNNKPHDLMQDVWLVRNTKQV